ncbi:MULTISPECIES: SDR family oxidoreductase [unclassified Nonomuraea]|uniref:SDR family oxidoreductase n=1 Tax=unclassified Nonomuraea TaxID=2593643 RepID=UPI0033E709CD
MRNDDNPFSLHGQTAVITGAGSGIGYSVALALAEAGADLVAASDRENLDDIRDHAEKLGRTVHTAVFDVADAQQMQSAVSEFAEDVDILVNNAGIIRRAPAERFTDGDWQDVLEVNLSAAFRICRLIGPGMLRRGQGKIINIASLLAFQGGLNVASYAASKHGLAGLTKALANEWGKYNVQANAIAPGYIITDTTKELQDDGIRSRQILDRIPAGRWGRADDIAGAAVFLASRASDYVNGHVLVVDGGWLSR